MLVEEGIAHEVCDTGVDDGVLAAPTVAAAAWVTALAYLKAVAAADLVPEGDLVLGADTVCVMDGEIIGQPRDDSHAARMVMGFAGRSHEVLTGVCLIRVGTGERWLRHDRALVWLGHPPMREVSAYVASGGWRGKAGGYNYIERLEAGWPLEVEGDVDTVVGLPRRVLWRMLAEAGVDGREGAGA